MPQVTYLEAIRQGIWEEMERDPAVFCIGEDIGVYGGAFKVTDGFIHHFGSERVIDTPIAESAIVGAAYGASLVGMRPVAEFQFMDFLGCAYNQIVNMVHTALEAAETLAKEGIEVEVLDLRSLMPLDREAIAATVKKTNKVIVLHEDTKTGGLAGEIAAIINEEAFEDLDGPIVRITSLDTPVPFSPPLEHYFLPKVEDVVREAKKLHAY